MKRFVLCVFLMVCAAFIFLACGSVLSDNEPNARSSEGQGDLSAQGGVVRQTAITLPSYARQTHESGFQANYV